MSKKLNMVRKHIINELEAGRLVAGDKLPGARELSERLGISHTITQVAFISLVKDGLLDSFPRSGTFVREDWCERILPDSLSSFRPIWTELLRKPLPDVSVHDVFRRGVFEIRTTLEVQQDRDEYMDLSSILHEEYPDLNDFFVQPFRNFRTDQGQLFGIPLVFSPRVLCYNPAILEKAGCPEPRSGWTWEEFIEDLKKLRRYYPAERIFNWGFDFSAMSFIFRAGGGIISAANGGTVMIDAPQSREGIAKVKEIYQVLGIDQKWPDPDKYEDAFHRGKCAFFMSPRQNTDFKSKTVWRNAPLPLIPGGSDLSAQATDLLCVRKQGADPALTRKLIRLILSREIQDEIGARRYGIPIRKSSAMKSFDMEDPRDTLFLSEMTKISAEYNFDSRELTNLILHGLHEIWLNDADIDQTIEELAAALRTVLKYRRFAVQAGENQKTA